MSTYGPITLDDWRRYWRNGQYLHVWLDGVEVTTSCYFADDVAGLVEVYERDERGRILVNPDTHRARTTSRYGKVEIMPEPIKGWNVGSSEVF